jgi:zinc transport system ATP-binding protein
MGLITFSHVAFDYDGDVVVQGLNFAVNQGDYLAVVGENGSGKTTLLRGLLRLKAPLRGTVQFDPTLTAGDVGYLGQSRSEKRDFPASVGEVVLSGCLARRGLRPFYRPEDKRTAKEWAAVLGLAGLEKHCFAELSGGQQQRVLLARALCAAKRLLVLDEPAANLDPLVTADLYRIVAEVNRSKGMTVVMVSHDIASALLHATAVLHLKGEQAFFGTPAEYRRSDIGREFM